MQHRIGGVIQDMNDVLEHFFGVHYPTLPEVIGSSGQLLFAPVIDPSVLISLKPGMFLVHLRQFRHTVSSGSYPHVCITEIM